MTAEIPADWLSETIGMIYDCALDPSGWTATLERLQFRLNFHNAVLETLALPSGTSLMQVANGIDPVWKARMNQYGGDIVDAWGGPVKLWNAPLYEPIVNTHATTPEQRAASRYIREWTRPQGIADAVLIGFVREPTMVSTLAMGRLESAGPIGETELAVLRLFSPHFRRALSISRLLDHQAIRLQAFEHTLDGLASAVLLVDAGLRLVFANRAGLDLEAAGEVMSLRNGVVSLADRRAEQQIRKALGLLGKGEAALDHRGMAVPARSAEDDPLVIHMLPLLGSGLRRSLMPEAVAALFVAPGPGMPSPPIEALATLYDLTPAEARIAELLSQGLPQTEIAATLGVAPSTVKTHLLQVFAKTGCKRQVEVAMLVRSFLRGT